MFQTLLADNGRKLFNKYAENLRQIRQLEADFTKLTDDDLRLKTQHLKHLIKNGEPVQNIINPAFALICQATERVLNIRHYDVQIIGGLILNEGKIAEMKTGEGKTLVALLPTFFKRIV